MALPSNNLSSVPIVAPLLAPELAGRAGRFEDFEEGGTALNDPSAGLQVQTWRVRIDGSDIKVGPHPGGPETTLFTAAGTTEVSLAFDQSMRPAVAFVQSGVAKLRWFDTVAAAQVITNIATGARTPMVTLDDKRAQSGSTSDILLAYLVDDKLMCRQQRDRFLIERTLKTGLSLSSSLHQVGMASNGRVHFVIQDAGLLQTIVGVMQVTDSGDDTFAATGTVTDPAPHRYWRLSDITVAGGFLEISELQLFESGVQATGATLSSTSAPGFGAVSDLADGNLMTRPYWAGAVVEGGGFSIKFDFGAGNEKAIDGVKQGGFDDSNRFMQQFNLEWSDDDAAWTSLGSVSGLTYPGNYTLSALIAVS